MDLIKQKALLAGLGTGETWGNLGKCKRFLDRVP